MPKICLVGAGAWGKNHLRTLAELDLLAGVVDRSERIRVDAQKRFPNITTFDDLDAALAQGFDGFVVATPAVTHFDIAAKILSAGIPALVEKPLALSSAAAIKLDEIAKANNTQVMVGHLLLFHPAIQRMKELIDEDKIGKIQYIYSNRLNLGTVRTEENILWSFAPHDISIFQYIIGTKPIDVSSQGAAFLQPEVHDTTMTTLRYPNNIMCHNFVSWLHPFKEHRIVAIGTKGMLSFEDSADSKELLSYKKGIDLIEGKLIKRDGEIEEVPYDNLMPLTEELKYFSSNLNKRFEKANADNAIEVLEILERATASSTNLENGTQPDNQVTISGAKVHETSEVDNNVEIGAGSSVWHFSHVQSGTRIGKNCSLGQNVNVGNNVIIGNNVRIQNNVSVFEGVELEDYVFCGPSMVFTNVLNPRAKYPQKGEVAYAKTLVKEGASLGANCTIVCGHTVGSNAFIAAGAVVASNVPDFALMAGVPAKQRGWVTAGGKILDLDFSGTVHCEVSGNSYQLENNQLLETLPT